MASLENQCEELRKQIKDNEEKLKQEQRHDEELPTEDMEPQTQILLAKEMALTAEIAALKQKQPSVLPKDKAVLGEKMKKQLETSISEMTDLLELLKAQTTQCQNDITRESSLKDELEQLNQVLKNKIASLEVPVNQLPEAAVEARLVAEQQSYEKDLLVYLKDLMKKMDSVIQKTFPKITDDALRKRTRQTPNIDYQPLQSMLEELMNLCIDSPHDPYITLTDQHWPPYTEMLLRFGVALRNPDNDKQIRLTPFHL